MAAKKTNPCRRCGVSRNPKNPAGYCRACWKHVKEPRTVAPALSVKRLRPRQRILFDVIMLGREWSKESQAEALCVIAATSDYEAEALWWQAGQSEPVHQHSGTALLQEWSSV